MNNKELSSRLIENNIGWDPDFIKSRFQGTPYKLGYESNVKNNGYDSISFGIGWDTPTLYAITISPKTVEYLKSLSGFGRIRGADYKKLVPYTSDFKIPNDIKDFNEMSGLVKI